ncbi:MAG TPA: N-acetyl-alpha-D-glucosaminyl L-malate synthase BshA [Candidatus Sulfotelmatobacter sp.]|nr:N-acetyl-alpha-D-glucosaminyl L-malate synthase BshA [Candidatus Sulfotelmatobacter sp.]
MRIGVTCYPTYGGSGVVATELGKALARRGHEIHFISYSLPFRLQRYDQRVFFHEVEMVNYPLLEHPPYAIALAAKMSEIGAQVGLDVFHVHYAVPHAVSAFLARAILGSGAPRIVTTLHGTDITLVGNDRSLYPMTRFALEQSDGMTCVSRYLQARTRQVFELSRPLEVIPNFVDTQRFRPAAGAAVRACLAPGGERLLIHLSNFRPVKRSPDAVRILARVRQELPARLLLVGDGQDRPLAMHLAESLGVAADVVSLGKQDDVESLLAAADLLVLPSEEESFGLAALEAMSCGTPVIATAVGGLPEVVQDGKTGFLLSVGDVEGMARACLALLTRPTQHAEFRQQARQDAVARFDAELIVPQYEAYYAKVLEGRTSDSSD